MRRRQHHDGRYGGGATSMDGTGLKAPPYTCEAHHILTDVEGSPPDINHERVSDQPYPVGRSKQPFKPAPHYKKGVAFGKE